VAKHNFPVSRLKIIRPATLSITPDGLSVARSLNLSRISFNEAVLLTETGYGAMPRLSSDSRFSRLILNCSGRSFSGIVPISLTIPLVHKT